MFRKIPDIQRDRNVYVDLGQTYLALKVKLVKGRGFDITIQQKRKWCTKKILFSLEQAMMTWNS